MIIAFFGTSGSGKTTAINHLKDWDYFKGKKVVIKSEDDFIILNFLKSLIGNKQFYEYKEQKFFDKKPNSLISIFFSWIVYWFYPVIIYIESLSIYLVYSTIWKNRILLSDRYTYDYLVTLEEVLNIKNPITGFLMSNFPKSHLSIYLKISKATSLSRNKNNIKGKITTNVNLHERILKRYDKLSKNYGIVTVSSDKDINATIKEIKGYIWAKDKLIGIKSLSMSGMDGSGKTTACNNLNIMCKQLGIQSKVVHFYHLPILYKLLRLFGYKSTHPNNQLIINSADEYVTSSVKSSFVWALLTFLDSYIQYIFARVVNFNSLIIFDRYFYDYLVSFEYRKVSGVRLFINFIPRPDIPRLFMIKPEEAFGRKTDNLSKDYFQKMYFLYKKVADEQNLDVLYIGNKDEKTIISEVIKSI